MLYDSRSFGEGARRARARFGRWLLGDPDPRYGRPYLTTAAIFGLIWLSDLYVHYGQPFNDGALFVAAWYGLLGASDVLPRRRRAVSVVLRVTAVVLLIGVVAWAGAFLLADAHGS